MLHQGCSALLRPRRGLCRKAQDSAQDSAQKTGSLDCKAQATSFKVPSSGCEGHWLGLLGGIGNGENTFLLSVPFGTLVLFP